MEINTSEEKQIYINSWKHAFNWKYYIWSILIGFVIAYFYIKVGEDYFKLFKIINFIIAVIATIQFKSMMIKRLAMFFFVGMLANITTSVTYYSSTYMYELITGNNVLKQQFINKYLKLNEKLPLKLADGITAIKYINENNSAIIIQIQINDLKENIMLEFNNILDFERFMLKNEIEHSCNNKIVREFLATDLILKMEYLDKEGNILGKISLDKNKCKAKNE